MFGNFQRRVQDWYGRLKINAGKGNHAALTVNQDVSSQAQLLSLQTGGNNVLTVDNTGALVLVPFSSVILFGERGKLSSGAFTATLGTTNGPVLTVGTDGFTRFGAGGVVYGPAANVLEFRNGTAAQESRLYGSYTSATAYQRLATKAIREAVTATAGASVTTTIAIPKYTHLIGVTTRVTTALGTTNGTTGYTVGDGTDADLWGAITGTAQGTTTDRNNFTAVDAMGPNGADRTITLTAVGGNFDGTGVIEVCAYYLAAEAD